jgi:hypothetical protein
LEVVKRGPEQGGEERRRELEETVASLQRDSRKMREELSALAQPRAVTAPLHIDDALRQQEARVRASIRDDIRNEFAAWGAAIRDDIRHQFAAWGASLSQFAQSTSSHTNLLHGSRGINDSVAPRIVFPQPLHPNSLPHSSDHAQLVSPSVSTRHFNTVDSNPMWASGGSFADLHSANTGDRLGSAQASMSSTSSQPRFGAAYTGSLQRGDRTLSLDGGTSSHASTVPPGWTGGKTGRRPPDLDFVLDHDRDSGSSPSSGRGTTPNQQGR